MKRLFWLLAAVCPFAAADDGTIDILPDGVTTFVISQEGSYVLADNVTMTAHVDCIQITAPDVTLDLNGHTIVGTSFVGISVAGRGARIFNGTIRDFLTQGIMVNAPDVHLWDLEFVNNAGGVFVQSGDRPLIENCVFFGGQGGAVIGQSTPLASPVVRSCVFRGSSGVGLQFNSTTNATAQDNIFARTGTSGFSNFGTATVAVNNLSHGNSTSQYQGVSPVSSLGATNEWGDNLQP